MEIRIIIPEAGSGTVTQTGSGTQFGADMQAGAMQAAGSMPSLGGMQPAAFGPPPGMAVAQGLQPSVPGVTPPPEVLRAAAALGAQDAGPAPMLGGFSTPGAPQQFTGSGSEFPAIVAATGRDHAAGAAPGSGMQMQTDTVD
jgi:hypothetical protein